MNARYFQQQQQQRQQQQQQEEKALDSKLMGQRRNENYFQHYFRKYEAYLNSKRSKPINLAEKVTMVFIVLVFAVCAMMLCMKWFHTAATIDAATDLANLNLNHSPTSRFYLFTENVRYASIQDRRNNILSTQAIANFHTFLDTKCMPAETVGSQSARDSSDNSTNGIYRTKDGVMVLCARITDVNENNAVTDGLLLKFGVLQFPALILDRNPTSTAAQGNADFITYSQEYDVSAFCSFLDSSLQQNSPAATMLSSVQIAIGFATIAIVVLVFNFI